MNVCSNNSYDRGSVLAAETSHRLYDSKMIKKRCTMWLGPWKFVSLGQRKCLKVQLNIKEIQIRCK